MSALFEPPPLASTPALYEDLANDKQEIRLLELHTSADTDATSGFPQYKLRTVSLQDNPIYDAISYVWGELADARPIVVNGHEVLISPRLWTALRTFSQIESLREVSMWADQVCINQSDLEERAAQVAMMGNIYRRANNVRIWLCPRSKTTDRVLTIMRDMISDGPHMDTMPESAIKSALTKLEQKKDLRQLSDDDFAAIYNLYTRSWWRRLWTVQEAALACKPILHMGESTAKFRPLLYLGQGMVKSSFTDDPNLLHDQATFAKMYDIAESTMPHYRALKMAGRLPNVEARKWAKNITMFFADISPCRAKEAHDHVYALLGLFPSALNITPNYRQSPEELFEEATRRIVESTNALDILVISGPLEEGPGTASNNAAYEPRDLKVSPTFQPKYPRLSLPSWVVNFQNSKPRPLQAPPGFFYNACGILSALKSSALKGELQVSALHIGTTETVDSPEFNMWDAKKQEETRAVLRKWSQVASSQESIVDSNLGFWNTVLNGAARYSNRRAAHLSDTESTKICASCEEWLRTNSTNSTPAKFPAIFQKHAPNGAMHFFVLDKGHFGIAQDVRVGDLVVVLAGLDFPAVLRPVKADRYQLVGCCFIDAIMRGEAVRAERDQGGSSDALPKGFETIVLI